MIKLVRISNWRAYGNVELQLEPGTTFLVAMNGVGKSSLIEAVQWAFDRTAKPDQERIRKGERLAVVEVDLLAGPSRLRIRRTLDLGTGKNPLKTPKSVTTTWVDDAERPPEEFFARLSAAWGADNQFVTRTAFLDDQLTTASAEPNLRAHLSRAYELDHLQNAISVLGPVISAAGKEAEAAHRLARETMADLQKAEQDVGTETSALAEADARETELRDEIRIASDALEAAMKRQNELRQLERWDAEHARLAEAAEPYVGRVEPSVGLITKLRAAHQGATTQLEQLRTDRARLLERIAALEASLAALTTSESECPVCRRPLDEAGRVHAHALHDHERGDAQRLLESLDLDGPATVASMLAELTARAERLGERPEMHTATALDVADAERVRDQAQAELEAHLAHVGSVRERLAAAVSHRDEITTRVSESNQATALYRRHGALEAARTALEVTVKQVLDTQLGPIGTEVGQRWDAVFPDRSGLHVDADGNISRDVGKDQIRYKSFSAGEKTVARLLFRLATLITTTNVPFCWIDEPLEHLDEKSRLVVARTLALFGREGYLDQILVTTYQQDIAMSLERNEGEKVRLEYLGTTPVSG